jgi:hypothetical protein
MGNAAEQAKLEKLRVEHSKPAEQADATQPIYGQQRWQPKSPRLSAAEQSALLDGQLLGDLDPKNERAAVEKVKARCKQARSRATHFDRLLTTAIESQREDRVTLLLSIRARVLGSRRSRNIRKFDLAIDAAVKCQNIALLGRLLDAHPHAGRDPADKSPRACIASWFRQVASWFDGGAAAWQRRHAAERLKGAALAGNTAIIKILLDRCMDLGKEARMLEPALRSAVESGKPDATRLLLQEVLKKKS